MSNSIIMMLLLQLVLIALNAVFACAEIAVISINDSRLEMLSNQGDKRARRLASLTEQPAKFLATIQVAITLSGFLGSAFAAENFSDIIVDFLVGMGIGVSPSTLHAVSVVFITLVLSYVTLIFGELVPKRVAMRKSEAMALGMSGLIYFISKIFAPIVWLLTISTNSVLRLIGIDPNAEDEEVSEEEIRMMVDVGSEKGTIDVEEKRLIENVFEFDDLTAGEVATHRTDVAFLYLEDSDETWVKTIRETSHSLYPVCNESADNIVGILNTRKYFLLEDKSRENIMANAVSNAYFVPDCVKADVLFANMKSTRNKLAVVLDEYGGMTGIVTILDLIEELVGDLQEVEISCDVPPSIVKIDDDTWEASGDALLGDIFDKMGVRNDNDERQTLNGFVFESLDEIPSDGSAFDLKSEGLAINVLSFKNHRIEKAFVSICDHELFDKNFLNNGNNDEDK